MASLLESAGAGGGHFSGIHTSKALHGEISNRFPLQDPSQYVVEKFYGGYQDCLLSGSNVEISPTNTWVNRPGSTAYTTFQFPSPPLGSFSFNQNGAFTLYVDTATDIYIVTPTSGTSIYTKSAGAGQCSYLQLGLTLFIVDGVDNIKIIAGKVWNWGIDGPNAAPSVNLVEGGSATASSWLANVIYSTMGLLVDSNGNVQQLQGVNANGTNPNSNVGETGNGQPAWNLTPGSTTSDGSITWTNYGPIVAWAPGKTFDNFTPTGGTLVDPCIVYDPVSQSCSVNANPSTASGITGTSKPSFTGGFASVVHDPTNTSSPPGVKWFCLGTPKAPALWQPSHSYPAIGVPNNLSVSCICTPLTPAAAGLGGANPQQIFLMVSSGGTSGTGGSAPPWSTQVGTLTSDNQLSWMCMGSATRANTTSYTGWSGQGAPFSVILDGAGNLQVCVSPGVNLSGSSAPTFNTLYGQTTTDGQVTWVCVGNSLSWATNTLWDLPTGGFIPPQPTDPYGGAAVNDTNGNSEFCINSGKSGSSAPSWNTTTGGQTTDNGVTWFNNGGFIANALAFTKGYAWCYAFKSRTPTDFFVLNIPNGLTVPLGAPTGSQDGSISTASPIFKLPTGPNAGAVMTVSGVGSLDPQVDTVVIYRCVDGSQGGPYFELTEIPAPPPINGVAQPWSFADTTTDINLDNLIEADVIGLNLPPPTGMTTIAYHQGRVWGAVSNIVFASSGNDIPPDNGNGLTGWAPANDFPLTSPVSKLLAPITGLLAFTTTDEWTIAGGPFITQYFPSVTRQGVGVLTMNAVATLGAEVIVFTADTRLLSFIPGAGETNIGWNVQDQLQTYDPSKVYLTLHENGIDFGLFLGNGSTTYKRVVLHSQPNNDVVWSPTATITGGCGMLQSIQTSAGVRSLLIGGTAANEVINFRDITANSDNGAAFAQHFVISPGPICHDGEMCELGFITFTGKRTGSAPLPSYLTDEISGTFTDFMGYVSDPPALYGATGQPATLYRNRYYFKQSDSSGNPPPALWCTDILLRVDFVTENAAHEVARFTLFGGLHKDKND